jgi:hypothetical protein
VSFRALKRPDDIRKDVDRDYIFERKFQEAIRVFSLIEIEKGVAGDK